jgi:anaerobic selenocysteine-containing dehydrogenase
MSEEKLYKTICPLCPPGCGLDVYVKDNKPVRVESMMESVVGPICIKAEVIPELYETELQNRILHPMKKVNGHWEQITWDEALDIVAQKLTELKQKYGPESFAVYRGHVDPNFDWSYWVRQFCMAHGTPSFYGTSNFCFNTKYVAHTYTMGQYAAATLITSKLLLSWAANPVGSVPFAGDRMILAKTLEKVKLIVVDPRRTLMAKAADIHLQLRPGTDGALALGMINVIISEGLYDKDFVEKYTVGFDKLAEHVKQYTPEKVEEITWVPKEKLVAAARMYATTKPANIFQGNCLDCVDNGFQACRAIAALVSITGSLDTRGGSTMMPIILFPKWVLEDTSKQKLPKVKAAGHDDHPLFFEVTGEPNVVGMYDAMLTGKPYPIKALIVEHGNPILTQADTNKQKRAFEKLDFMAVHDLYMTETAEYADLFLPAAYFLEEQCIYQYVGRPMIALQQKIIDPPEDCWPIWKLWFELAKRMGYEKDLPWKDVEEAENHILQRINCTVDDLRASPAGYFYEKRVWKKYENVPGWKFNTPSGKVELYSERLEKMGIDPLPTYHEPAESPANRPDLAKYYPLILITGNRSLYYLHDEHRHVPTLRSKDPEPVVEINTETAGKLGIQTGDQVVIENQRGFCRMKAAVTSDIHPKVVSVAHGWSRDANQNYLTSWDVRDQVVGCPAFRAIPCRVRKVGVGHAMDPQYAGNI